MSLMKVFNISGSAVSAQSQRLNVVASNLANAESVAGPDGQTATRAASRSAEGGATTTTGPKGQIRTRHSTRDGEGEGSTTITRAHGGTVTREATRSLP